VIWRRSEVLEKSGPDTKEKARPTGSFGSSTLCLKCCNVWLEVRTHESGKQGVEPSALGRAQVLMGNPLRWQPAEAQLTSDQSRERRAHENVAVSRIHWRPCSVLCVIAGIYFFGGLNEAADAAVNERSLGPSIDAKASRAD
jgi:hypothetical protein